MEGDLVDYHCIAKELWKLMFLAFHGGAICNEEQMKYYKEAREIAHHNLDLGAKIHLMSPPPPEKEHE